MWIKAEEEKKSSNNDINKVFLERQERQEEDAQLLYARTKLKLLSRERFHKLHSIAISTIVNSD